MLELTAPVDGYMYIYVANETDNDINVYFDNLIITHTGLQVVEHTDYYPYGMVMRKELPSQGQGIYSRYRYGYQGQFAEKDEETGWNHFELRNYGSRIGRWTATDPYRQYASPYVGMGNNPVSKVDPDGGFDNIYYNSSTGKTTIVETSGPDRLFIDGKFSGIMGADGSWRDMGFDVNQYIMFEAVINSPIGDKAQFNFNQKIRDSRRNFMFTSLDIARKSFGKVGFVSTGAGLLIAPFVPPVGAAFIVAGESLSFVAGASSVLYNVGQGNVTEAGIDVAFMVTAGVGKELLNNSVNKEIISETSEIVLKASLNLNLEVHNNFTRPLITNSVSNK